MMFTAVVVLCVALASAAPALEGEYNYTILERGVLVQEQITVRPGLQIFHVPKHNDLQHVKVFLDFHNKLQLTSFEDLGKCHLQHLDVPEPDLREEIDALETVKTSGRIEWAEEFQTQSIAKIVSPEPLNDTSFLRAELRAACQGRPVYWARGVDISDKDGEEAFLVPAESSDVARVKRQSGMCNFLDMVQKCRRKQDRELACYYIIICALTKANRHTCKKHSLNTNLVCKLCCSSPSYQHDPSGLPHCKYLG